jgi:peptidoglycan/LPS O-acetylase OafA/YrhL
VTDPLAPARQQSSRQAAGELGYRPEIDGLRALAVLPVMFFHAGFEMFAGGFVGVDVFFVISGYLITSIIRREMAAGAFSILGFYERRVRRILPALFLVTAACIPFAWAWMLPGEFKDFAQSVVAVNLFASNFLFWKESGYFALTAELKPLLHTWSLAVEEQFYVTFPLLLLLLRRVRERTLFAVIFILTLASFALAEWMSVRHPDANFYLLPTRAWELGVGALLAIVLPSIKARIFGALAEAGALAGLALIGFAVFTLDGDAPFPGIWALAPVLGTAALIACAGPKTWVGRILAWRPIVFVGLISYSAYLWHQPLFAFARLRCYECAIPAYGYGALTGLSLLLAALTWAFVERPFRRKGAVGRTPLFAGAAGVAAAFIGLGFVGAHFGVSRASAEVRELAAWSSDSSPHRWSCHNADPREACILGARSGAPLFVWGDSHGAELAWRLAGQLEAHAAPVIQLTHSDCPPTAGVHAPRQIARQSCLDFTEAALARLEAEPAGAMVVLVARWPEVFETGKFDNGEGGVEPHDYDRTMVPIEESAAFLDDPGRIDAVGARVRATIEALLASGHRVVLLYPIPEVGWNVPHRLARERLLGVARETPLSTSVSAYRARTANATAQLDRLREHPNLIRVRPADIFCDTDLPGRCVAERDGAPLYFDDDHLNSIGADLIAARIIAAMQARAWLGEATATDD